MMERERPPLGGEMQKDSAAGQKQAHDDAEVAVNQATAPDNPFKVDDTDVREAMYAEAKKPIEPPSRARISEMLLRKGVRPQPTRSRKTPPISSSADHRSALPVRRTSGLRGGLQERGWRGADTLGKVRLTRAVKK